MGLAVASEARQGTAARVDMDPDDDGADENDELFVRPVMRVAAPVPAPTDSGDANADLVGKRHRSQVLMRTSLCSQHPSARPLPRMQIFAEVARDLTRSGPGLACAIAGAEATLERAAGTKFGIAWRLAEGHNAHGRRGPISKGA